MKIRMIKNFEIKIENKKTEFKKGNFYETSALVAYSLISKKVAENVNDREKEFNDNKSLKHLRSLKDPRLGKKETV